jgi:hypothetical protein
MNFSQHILKKLDGRDNLILMCNAHDFVEGSRRVDFSVPEYKVQISEYDGTSLYGESEVMCNVYFYSTCGLKKREYLCVCDWFLPDLFTIVTGYHLSFD